MSKEKILTKEIAEQFLKDPDWNNNYTVVEDDAAELLAQYKGELPLMKVKNLSVAAATSLAKIKPVHGEHNWIQLDSLSLTPELASALAKYQGDQLCFGCTSIDLDTVKAFRPFKGMLWLGVTHLDDEVAVELAQHNGGLGLNGLTSLNDAATQALAQFEGPKIWASAEIVKSLQTVRRAYVKSAIRENRLRKPAEWQRDRIVPSKTPAKPLKGRGAEREKAADATWWLPNKVCSWFVQKLDDAHKVSVSGDGYGAAKSTYISPEAAALLRKHSSAWLWLMENEAKGAKEKEAAGLQSLAKIKPPKQFKAGKVSLPKPKQSVAKAYCWKPDFEGEDYQSVLHYYGYLPSEHVGSITDPNGYPAKAMSPEAADLYRQHRAFWEAKHAESKAQTKAASKLRKQEAEQRVERAAKTAGLSREELEAKLDRLAGLAEQGDLKLIGEMVAGFEDPWLYQALLAGASITSEGDLKPGKVLKRFKHQAEFIMLLAVAFMPEGVEADPSIRRDASVVLEVNDSNIDVVAEMIAPRFAGLKPDVEGMESLKKLLLPTAEFLAQRNGGLGLTGLTSLSDVAAQALAKHKGELRLDGLTSLSDAAAQALAKHKGHLDLRRLTSLSDSLGHVALAQKLAQNEGTLWLYGLTSLSDAAAQALAQHAGDLHLSGLTSLSDAAAQALAQHKGVLCLGIVAAEKVRRARRRLTGARLFESRGSDSSKFWDTELRGAELVVRFGRLGTDGQEKIKVFPDAAAATKEQAKLIKEKLGKGYKEV